MEITNLPAQTVTIMGAMALITPCLLTITMNEATSEALYNAHSLELEAQITVLRGVVNQILRQTGTRVTSDVKWPAPHITSNRSRGPWRTPFCILVLLAWSALLVCLFDSLGKVSMAAAHSSMAAGVWTACVVFVDSLMFSAERKLNCYLLNASWGLYAGVALWIMLCENGKEAKSRACHKVSASKE